MSSNDLSQVRDYIKTRMLVVEPTFSEWTDSLTDIGNIPKTLLDTIYHITLGPGNSTDQIDNHIEEDFTSIVTIFRRAYNNPVEVRDQILQTANCIRLDIINPLNIEEYKFANDGNIESVVSVSITPEEIDASNDNIIKVEIELNVRLFFGIT